MIYFAAPDGFLVALDAKTGKVRWETKIDNGEITAGGILVADGKVLTNRTCMQSKREILLHRRARRQDRQGGLEVLHHRSTRRAGRRHLGQHAGRAARGRSLGPAGLLRSESQNHLLGHRQSESLHAPDASRQPGRASRTRRRPISTATRRSRSTSRPASSAGTTRSCRATTGMPITTRSACLCARSSIPMPGM